MDQSFNASETPERFIRIVGTPNWSFEKAQEKKVTIIGAGGLGITAAVSLAKMGIGIINIIDYDNVEMVNTNRFFFRESMIGIPKVEAVEKIIFEEAPDTQVNPISEDIFSFEEFENILCASDVILTCADNVRVRKYTNYLAIKNRINVIDAGVSLDGFSGNVQSIIPFESACYDCIPIINFTEATEEKPAMTNKISYANSLAPAVAHVATAQAFEAFKLLFNIGKVIQYLEIDMFTGFWKAKKIMRNPDCPTCNVSLD